MKHCILIGCDVHEKTLVLRIAHGKGHPREVRVPNAPADRAELVRRLRALARKHHADVHFAYEASGIGFGLYDQLTEAGFRACVLAPSRMEKSSREKKTKTDSRDADKILALLRAHVLAGNDLPAVWIPPRTTRADRDLVRLRQDVNHNVTALKSRIRSLLRLHEIHPPEDAGRGWTAPWRAWLASLADDASPLLPSSRLALASLLRQLDHAESEKKRLEKEVERLAATPRYREPVEALSRLRGVSSYTAMVFCTEIGDPRRFRNRRQLGAFLGLVPSSHESGEKGDVKGRITRQGPGRIRAALCQASWAGIRSDGALHRLHRRLVGKNPKRRKIALVAVMRKRALRMWHAAKDAWPAEEWAGLQANA